MYIPHNYQKAMLKESCQ